MLNSDNFPQDQTTFVSERTFYQKPEMSAAEVARQQQPPPPKKPWSKKKFVLVAIPILLLVVIFGLIFLIPKKAPKEEKPEEIEVAPSTSVESDYMVERIKRLQSELKQADPTKAELLFPPVDMGIELDSPRRR